MRADEGNGQRMLFERASGVRSADENGDPKASKRGRPSRSAQRAPEEVAAHLVSAITPLIERLEVRLGAVEAELQRLHEELNVRSVTKEFYSTAEVAKILGKRPYTVREWCRLGRVNGQKAFSGRGLDEEWRISHDELVRIQNEGLLEAKPARHVGSAGRVKRPR